MTTPRRKRTFLHDETGLRCPDCGAVSVVQVSSLLGSTNTELAQVDALLLQHVLAEYHARWSEEGLACSSCPGRHPKLHWLLLHADSAAGPWCLQCLRSHVQNQIETEKGLDQDLLVLSIQASKKNYRIAGHVSVSEAPPAAPIPDPLLF